MSTDRATDSQHADRSAQARQPKATPQSGLKATDANAAGLLSDAIADPAHATSAAVLQLQRTAGNRAVRKLLARNEIQAKLTVGPAGDQYEQEADRVASQVMSASISESAPPNQTQQKEENVQRSPLAASISPVRRQELRRDGIQEKPGPAPMAGEGFAAGADVEHRLASNQGGGKPLPSETRSFMESRFGSDFGGVRVHTGTESVQLNRDLSAQAFTQGRHVYFGDGKYNPGTQGGKKLLAHELTHVVQQGGARAANTQRKFEVSRTHRPDMVQGKWTDSIKKAGKKASNKVRSLWGRADRSDQPTETANPFLEGASAEEQSTFANIMHGSLAASMPDYEDPALAEQEPDNYKVTLAAAQEDVNWLQNVKDLKKAALKTAVTSPKKFKAGMADDPEEFMAHRVLSNRGELEGKSEAEQQELVEEFSGGIHNVGHTWVRLSTYVEGKLQRLWSFGFWPLKLPDPFTDENEGGYAGFATPGPGQVKHPDVAHEGDADKAYMDYEVRPKQFEKALGKATNRFASPPPYVLVGYNCTAFAREVLRAAGKSYPSSGLILPGVAYTPGALYAAIISRSKKRGSTKAHTDDVHSDVVKQVSEETEERQAEAKSSVMRGYFSGAPRVSLTLKAGKSVRMGKNPIDRREKSMKTWNIDKPTEVTAIRHDEFMNVWDAVPLEVGPKLRYAHPKDLKAAIKKSKPIEAPPSAAESGGVDADVSGGELVEAYDPADYPAGEYHIPEDGLTEVVKLMVAAAPGGELTSEVELFPGEKVHVFIEDDLTTTYGQCRVKYFSRNYFAPIGSLFAPLHVEGKDLDELDEDVDASVSEEAEVTDTFDPADYPAGEHHIPEEGLTEVVKLMVAAAPGGELTSEVELYPGEKFHVFIEDDLTTTYGQCRVKYFSRNYYAPIGSLFAPLHVDGKDLDEDVDASVSEEAEVTDTFDPADYAAGEYYIPEEGLDEAMKLMVAAAAGGELTSEVELFPGEKFHVFIEDDLTTTYGQCRVKYFSRNYYAPLRVLFGSVDTEVTELHEVEDTPEETSVSADEPKPDVMPFPEDVLQAIGYGSTFQELVQMNMADINDFKNLSPKYITELAARYKRSEESIKEEIAELH